MIHKPTGVTLSQETKTPDQQMKVKSPHFAIKLLKQGSQLSNRYLGFLESKIQVRTPQSSQNRYENHSGTCCVQWLVDNLIKVYMFKIHFSLKIFRPNFDSLYVLGHFFMVKFQPVMWLLNKPLLWLLKDISSLFFFISKLKISPQTSSL